MQTRPIGGLDERDLLRGSSVSLSDELLVDLALLDERVEDVENRVARPDLMTKDRREQGVSISSLSLVFFK